jgi:uncharacterized protein
MPENCHRLSLPLPHPSVRARRSLAFHRAHPIHHLSRALAALLLMVTCNAALAAAADVTPNCHIGVYHLRDGSDVDIAPGESPHLRWRRKDGTSGELTEAANGSWTSTLGWTSRPDGKQVSFTACPQGGITFAGVSGQRIKLEVTDSRFQGSGATLAGRLIMPSGQGVVPLVVLVHGSEDLSALQFYALQRLFPSAGIGAFVYDKRGTGVSGGNYTHDYELLGKDAVAAMREARRLAGARAGRVGYQGTSQGGWVAPLAASYAPVDFVVVAYGLAVSPLDEDREAIALDMTRRGYGPDVMAKAMQVADATAAILRSNFQDGYERLKAVRTEYGNEPWFKYVHGDITFAVLATPPAELRVQGPKLIPDIRPEYDPMPVLRRLNTPQLWILGGQDTDAPSAETARRLAGLASAGRPITTVVFPRAEHGILEFEETPLPEGVRTDTRNADGYFDVMCDFIRYGRLLHPHYGSAVILTTAANRG